MKIVKLFVALLSLYVVATVIIPRINTLPFLSDVQKVVHKWDINTAAFFYTDNISSNKEIQKLTNK